MPQSATGPSPRAESAPSSAPLELRTPAGHLLRGRLFAPRGPRRGDIVIHGALATPQQFYGPFAAGLADQGFRVLTYDYPGFGASRTTDEPSGLDLDAWIADAVPAASAVLHRQDPSPHQFAVGHSFGGQAAALLPHGLHPEAMVFVGVMRGWLGGFPLPRRVRFGLAMGVVMPVITALFGYLPGWVGLGHDLPRGVADQWRRWCSHPEYYLAEHPEYRQRLASYRGSIYALSFTDDELAPLNNVRWLLDRFVGANVMHQHLDPTSIDLPPIGHHGLFRGHAHPLWGVIGDYFKGSGDADVTGVPGVPFFPTPRLQDSDVAADLSHGRD